jgi:DNA-binding NtrC family response regulator
VYEAPNVFPERTRHCEELPPEELIFGKSALMQAIRKELEQTGPTGLPLLIEGESGCGKEVLGRLVHQKSPRVNKGFVKVACPALRSSVGGTKAFSGEPDGLLSAWMPTCAQAEAAEKGTLFLDEISELEWPLQTMLLRLLQDEPISRAWSTKLDTRIISSSENGLEKQVKSGAFRKDLYYRINLIHIHVPPLRSRAGDIPELVNYMLGVYQRKLHVPVRAFPRNLVRLFQSYDWPGNIRQLQTMVERYVVMGSEQVITTELLDESQSKLAASAVPDESVHLRS